LEHLFLPFLRREVLLPLLQPLLNLFFFCWAQNLLGLLVFFKALLVEPDQLVRLLIASSSLVVSPSILVLPFLRLVVVSITLLLLVVWIRRTLVRVPRGLLEVLDWVGLLSKIE